MTQEETEHPLVSLASLTIEPFLFVTCLLAILYVVFLPLCILRINRRSKLQHIADVMRRGISNDCVLNLVSLDLLTSPRVIFCAFPFCDFSSHQIIHAAVITLSTYDFAIQLFGGLSRD